MEKKGELKEILVDIYPKVYRNLTGSKTYKFKLDEKRSLQIDKFLDKVLSLIKSPGEDFLVRYLQYAFGKYAGRKNHWGGKNAFPLTWIISVKLLKEFLEVNKDDKEIKKWRFNRERKEIRETTGKKSTDLIKSDKRKQREWKEKKGILLTVNELEEAEKERYHNTNKGKYWCIDFTTLFNPVSELCESCKFAEECKRLLEKNYPNIYKVRI